MYAGATIAFPSAKAGEQTGATGVPGEVDNHWPQVVAGAFISAILNIGVRAPFGSTQNFQPSLQQEYAADVATSLNRSAQGAVKRALDRPPTIRATRGDPVTIQLLDNISFQTEPVLIRK